MDHERIRSAIDQVCNFITNYLPLANAHNTDFIVDDKWNLIPQSIAAELNSLTEQEIVELPSCNRVACQAGPCILLAETKDLTDLQSVKGTWCQSRPPKWDKTLKPRWVHSTLDEFLRHARQATLPALGVLTDVKEVLPKCTDRVFVDKFLSLKKCHEIDQMTEICHRLAAEYNIDKVVDIGSGRGYLGCHLALMHNYKVLGIDSSPGNTQSASKRSQRLEKQWNGLLKNAAVNQASINGSNPKCDSGDTLKNREYLSNKFVPLTEFVTRETDIQALLKDSFSSHPLDCHVDEREVGAPDRHMMTGLHTCGTLATSIIRLFVQYDHAKILCNVGCCYNHIEEEYLTSPFMTEDDPEPKENGFPVSKYLRDRKLQLGRNARMLAVQAPDRITTEQKLPAKSIYWRALLQVILRDLMGETRDDWQVGKVASKCATFVEYCRKSLEKLKIPHNLSDGDLKAYQERYEHQERKMNSFFQLRASLAACVEAAILLDRLLFLLEQDSIIKDAYLVQLFDPVKSPRCYAIVAIKKD